MNFKSKIFQIALFAAMLSCFSMQAQGVSVGHLSLTGAVLTTTSSQFTTDIASDFPGKSYSNLILTTSSDGLGTLYYLNATITTGGNSYPAKIILSESGGQIRFTSTDGCEMKCDPSLPCSGGCTQNIIVRCKSQTCTCTAETGSCDSSITFSNR